MGGVIETVVAIAAAAGAEAVVGALGITGLTAKVLIAAAATGAVGLVSQRASKGIAPTRGRPTFSSTVIGRSIIVRSAVDTHRVIYGRTRVSGPLVYFSTTEAVEAKLVDGSFLARQDTRLNNIFFNMVIVLASHEVEEIETIQLDDVFLTLDSDGYATNDEFKGKIVGTALDHHLVRVIKHLGSPNQLADAKMVNEIPEWTNDHRLRGRAYIYIRLMFQQDKFPNGIPQVRAIVKGKKLFDPRDSSTSFSDNWALCIRDYITNSEYGFGADADEIDDASFIAAANASDENEPLKDGSSRNRYTANGAIDTENKPIDNLSELITGGAGAVTYQQGEFHCHAGIFDSPSVTIDESWLRAPLIVQARPPRAEIFNAIRGVYQDENKFWQPIDFPPLKNDFFKTEDNEERIFEDIELPFTNNEEAAQRIAKIVLEKSRQGIIVEMPCNLQATEIAVWDTVKVNNSALGWSEKIFRVMKWKLNSAGGVDLILQEESSASYEWNSGEATVNDPAPDTDLPSAFEIETPGTPVVVEEQFVTNDGGSVRTKAVITWEAAPDAFVFRYCVQFKLTSDTIFINAGETNDTTFTIFDLAAGTYNFQVKAINTVFVSSDFVSTTKELFGLTAPPEDITNFLINTLHNNAHLQWDQSPDLDVKVAGKIRLRHSSRIIGATWSEARDLGDALPGISTKATVELLEGTYLIKAVDSTGNESVNATAISTDVADIVKMNFVDNSVQDPTFTGTKTDMVVNVDNELILAGASLFDAKTGLFDSATGFFDSGDGFKQAGIYTFDDIIDFGSVYVTRVTSKITNTVFDATNDFDGSPGLFDARDGKFDGDDISTMDIDLFIRTTNSDPATFNLFDSVPGLFDSTPGLFDDAAIFGTNDWSLFRKFVVGDYNARAFDFKLTVTSQFSSHNVEISELSVSLDVPDREETEEDLVLLAAGQTFIFDKPFFIVPNVGISMQDSATGDYFNVTAKSKTGFTLQTFNSSDVGISRKVDWIAKGF